MERKKTDDLIKITHEIEDAIKAMKPVVALESTIISHGMKYPENVETARNLEKIIRENHCVPATIALIKGRIHIGITDDELEFLGKSNDVKKVSRRDIPVIIAEKESGATTVSATMYLAMISGIRFFVTGGIGGVHRGAENNFDVSADLTELSKTSVAVICAGAKSILDLPLTVEKLETYGVPVLGYNTDEFPSFYSRKSGLKVDWRVDSPESAAKIIRSKWDLGLDGGVLIVNPIPCKDEIPFEEIDEYIEKALLDAKTKNIKGKILTPYLLSKLSDMTDGRTLRANIALVKNNAFVGARISAAYWKAESVSN